MDRDIDWALLTRYLTGQCTPQEEQEFARWVAADEARAAWVATMRKAWRESGTLPPRVDIDAAFENTAARLGLDEASTTPSRTEDASVIALHSRRRVTTRPPLHARPRPRRARWLAAAVAGIAAAAGLWQMSTAGPEPEPNFADGAATHITQPGQRLERRLPDGTRVLLSAVSVLRVPEDYGRRSRRVFLEGEGFFEVMRDADRPFVVHLRTASPRRSAPSSACGRT